MPFRYLLPIVFLFVLHRGYAQNTSKSSADGVDTSTYHFLEIEQLMEKGGYILAIEALERINASAPKSYTCLRLLGKSYLALQQYDQAEKTYQKLRFLKAKKPEPFVLFHLAFAQYRQGKRQEVIDNLALFEASRPPFNPTIWAEMKLMKAALARKEALPTSADHFLMDTTFRFPNSAYADFSPLSLGDTAFLFSSLRKDSLVERTPGQPNYNTIQLFHYKVRPDGRFDEIGVIRNLNRRGRHAGNGCYSADGKRFFFTRCVDTDKGQLKCAVYEAEVNKDGSFHKVRKLSDRINKWKYSSSQPFFTTITQNNQEQDVLYFVSNRRGGFGQNDIWYSLYNRKRKRFSAPLNCGNQINSPGNDESPFIDPTGSRFFFSSDGHPGFGGKDIYAAKANGVMLGGRELLNEPINSQADDQYFHLASDGKSGYFSSNRKGANLLDQKYCCADVFRFISEWPKPKPEEEKQIVSIDSVKSVEQAIVFTAVEPEPAAAAPKQEVVEQPVVVNAEKTEATPPVERKPQAVDAREIRTDASVATSRLAKAKVPGSQKDNTARRKVFFAKCGAVLTPKSALLLESIVKEIRQQKPKSVTIRGFADHKGELPYNQKLSAERAKTIRNYCLRHKVKVPIRLVPSDLSTALQTEDEDMLSMDRFAEIVWERRR